MFDAAQRQLALGRVDRQLGRSTPDPSLLAGLLRDAHGRRMSPGHAAKRGKRYRYYHSRTDDLNAQLHPVWRVSAPDIESSVITAVIDMLHEAVGSCVHANASAAQIERVRAIVAAASTRLQAGTGREQRQLLDELVSDVEVHQDRRQPRDLNRSKLIRWAGLPLCWNLQKIVLGFA